MHTKKNARFFFLFAAILTVALALSLSACATSEDKAASEAADSSTEPAQEERASPHETVTATVGEANIEVVYGRPYKKNRAIFGELVPYGEVWRTGADEATTLKTDKDLMIGDLEVPAGTYSLFTIPGEEQWMLVLNKEPEQWGAYKYNQEMDLGRTPMAVGAAEEMEEQLTIGFVERDGKNMMTICWDETEASVAVAVK
jgi:hypothetical protein